MPNSDLQVIVQESGLAENKVQELMAHFGNAFQEAHKLAESSKGITVTSEDQVEEMNKARQARLSLKNLRVQVENTRKELKEQSLREGKAIDGAANIIKALIAPIEEHLEKQEKFAEELQKQKKIAKIEERKRLLSQYVSDISVYDLENLSTETFEKLLSDAKVAFEAQQEAGKKAEEERVAAEKKRKEDQEKILKENEELKKKQEEQDRLLAEERKKAAEEKRLQEEQIQKEREAKEKVEKELEAKKQAEEKAKKDEEMRLEKERIDKEQAMKQAELAPDKDKMRVFYTQLSALTDQIGTMELTTPEAQDVANKAFTDLRTVMANLVINMKKI